MTKHPICSDLFIDESDCLIFQFMTVNIKNNQLISQNINKILKNIRRRSFYTALNIVSYIENSVERNTILQILYSVTTYSENNYSSNLLNIWIHEIYIKQTMNSNQFIDKDSHKLKDNNDIIITLGFQYKVPPIKNEPIR